MSFTSVYCRNIITTWINLWLLNVCATVFYCKGVFMYAWLLLKWVLPLASEQKRVPKFLSSTYRQQEGGWKGLRVEYRRTSSLVETDWNVSCSGQQRCKHDCHSCPCSSENKPASHAIINQQQLKLELKDVVSADMHTCVGHQYPDCLIQDALSVCCLKSRPLRCPACFLSAGQHLQRDINAHLTGG